MIAVNCLNEKQIILESRINGGKNASYGNVPYIASITSKLRGGRQRHVCAGAIISPLSIVSTRDCVKYCQSNKTCSGFVGRVNLCSGGYRVKISDYITSDQEGIDIGIFRTDTIYFTKYISPIELAAKDLEGSTSVIISGWSKRVNFL